jgi:endo-1,4-beta-xylanase
MIQSIFRKIQLHLRRLLYLLDDYRYFIYSFFPVSKRQTLKGAYSGKFLTGTCINSAVYLHKDKEALRILRREFNSVTPENCMKMSCIHPTVNCFNFEETDRYVKFAQRNRMINVGHTLIFGLMTPKWFFLDEKGDEISKEELIIRMKTHITTVVQRYRKQIKIWEVLNDVLFVDGSYLKNRYYKILGEDYVKYAFQFAREANPDAILYYTDAYLSKVKKREKAIAMVKKLQSEGIQIDGIGMQGHCHLGIPDIKELEDSIKAFSELGCRVSITEMDFSVLPTYYSPNLDTDMALNPEYIRQLNPFAEKIPPKIADAQYAQYKNMFKIFLQYSDKIDRVTFWGISDKYSSKNDFPIPGRTDYPLLFDRNYRAKPVVKELIELGNF